MTAPGKLTHIPSTLLQAWQAIQQDGLAHEAQIQTCKHLTGLINAQPEAEALAQALLWKTYQGTATDAAGMTVAHLIVHAHANPLDYLLEHGAIPLHLISPTMQALWVREERHLPRLRLHDGGNIVHYLCSVHQLGQVNSLLRSGLVHASWTNEARSDGATPLIVLWDTLLNNYSTPKDVWETSALLLDCGCNPLAVDRQGRGIRQILAQVAAGHKAIVFDGADRHRDGVLGRIEAARQQRELAEHTAPAPAAGTQRRI